MTFCSSPLWVKKIIILVLFSLLKWFFSTLCYCADNISKLLNKIDNINAIVLECSRNAELWEGSENSQQFSSGPDNRLLSTACSLQIGSRVRATVNDINLVTEQEEGTAESWDFLSSPDLGLRWCYIGLYSYEYNPQDLAPLWAISKGRGHWRKYCRFLYH